MLRHLAASWLFAGFLVVVAVVTWRVLDARTPDTPPALTPVPAPPVVVAAARDVPDVADMPEPAPASSCGSAHDPFDAARADAPVRHVAAGEARLQFGSQPFADFYLDGKHLGATPFFGPRKLTLPLGVHDVELRDEAGGQRRFYRLTVSADDPQNEVLVVIAADMQRVSGAVTLVSLQPEPAAHTAVDQRTPRSAARTP